MIKDKLKKDIAVTAISQVVIMLLLVIMNKVLSISLGPDNYTIYSIMNKTATLWAFFIIFAMGIAIPRYIPLYLGAQKVNKAGDFVKYGLILMILLIFISGIFVFFFKNTLSLIIFGTDNYLKNIYAIYIYAVGLGCFTFLYSYYRGLNNFFSYNIVQIVNRVYLLSIVFFVGTNLFYIFCWWGVIMTLTSLLVLIYSIQKDFEINFYSIKYIKFKSAIKEILSFCMPRLPGEIILFSFVSIPMIILNNKIGSNHTAGFVVGIMLSSMITPLFGLVGTVLLPYMSKRLGEQKGFSELKRRISSLLKIYVLVSIVAILIIVFFGKEIIYILFSVEYIQYSNIVSGLSLSILPNAIYLLLRNPIDAISKIPYNTINLIISFTVLISILLLGNSELIFVIAFLLAYWILGILSYVVWFFLGNKVKEDV